MRAVRQTTSITGREGKRAQASGKLGKKWGAHFDLSKNC